VEKFIRQLPLVIAIILMISNCQSANDPSGGNGGDSSGYAGGQGGGGQGGGQGGQGSGSGGLILGGQGSDPSDSVTVDLPQQAGSSWSMVKTRLSTVTKYDIYTRLTSYNSDMLKQANAQAAMGVARNNQVMQMQVQQQMGRVQQQAMFSGAGGGQQLAQMNQYAQMTQYQLQQQLQVMAQQMQGAQMQNQQLQMQNQRLQMQSQQMHAHLQAGGSYSDFMAAQGESESKEDSEGQEEKEKEEESSCKKEREKLKEIADVLGGNPTDDLVAVIEERLGKSREGGKGEEEGQKPRASSRAPLGAKGSQARDAEDDGDDKEDNFSKFKTSTKTKQDRVVAKGQEEGDEEGEAVEEHIFDPKTAPKSLEPAQLAQLKKWQECRAELMQKAGCSLSNDLATLSEPEKWALLKQAFEGLRGHVGCAE